MNVDSCELTVVSTTHAQTLHQCERMHMNYCQTCFCHLGLSAGCVFVKKKMFWLVEVCCQEGRHCGNGLPGTAEVRYVEQLISIYCSHEAMILPMQLKTNWLYIMD